MRKHIPWSVAVKNTKVAEEREYMHDRRLVLLFGQDAEYIKGLLQESPDITIKELSDRLFEKGRSVLFTACPR